ncbi:MAG: hypothetical protein MJZ37_07855 [Bacilli bacterium]|nr:hypothetical protein [Bacilli bacterium]
MFDLRVIDLSKTEDEDGYVDFIALTIEQWALTKSFIKEIKDNERCEFVCGADIKKCIDNIGADAPEMISGLCITMLHDFMKDCRKMAQENWCPSQVEMLDRLFEAVSLDKKYDEV